MKIYYFHPKTGIFQGEGYEIDRWVAEGEGVTTVPPPAWEKGTIPVFDPMQAAWSIVSISKTASRTDDVRSNPDPRER